MLFSVTKSCLTLCDLMDCSTPGFPVLHYSRVCSNNLVPSKHSVSEFCLLCLLPKLWSGWKVGVHVCSRHLTWGWEGLVGPGVGTIILAHQVAPLLASWSFVSIAWWFFLLCGPSTPHLLEALACTHRSGLISALQLSWKSFLSCLLFPLYSYLAHPLRVLGEAQDPSCPHQEGLASKSAVSLSSQTVMSCFQEWSPSAVEHRLPGCCLLQDSQWTVGQWASSADFHSTTHLQRWFRAHP